ncbi:MAG: CRISPR-associated protein Csx15 [Anaerolineae bacterium]
MILINLSHPITAAQREQIETLIGGTITRDVAAPTHFDTDQPFVPQVLALLDALPLTQTDWQSEPILLNPPALNFIAAALLAELHGRMGHFPALLRLHPVAGSVPTRYEVAEIIDLQALRQDARSRREAPTT